MKEIEVKEKKLRNEMIEKEKEILEKENELSELTRRLEDLTNQLEVKTLETNAKTEELDTLEHDTVTDLQEQVENLKQQIDRLENAKSAQDLEQTEKRQKLEHKVKEARKERDQQEDKAAKIEQERTEVQKDLESLQEATRQIVVTSLSLHIASTRDQGFSRRTEEPNLFSYGAESVRHTAHQKIDTSDKGHTQKRTCEQEQELVRLKDDTENAEKEVILLKNQLAPTEGRLHRHADEQITLSKEKVDLEKEVEHLREELEEKEGLNLTLKDQSRDSEEKQQAKAEKFMVFGCIQLD
ncbi:hypothetical protein BLNAU_15023 [Blattamonas nauphoetae]|uniref:Uncharacterized protein n=1 Tax=Blattamonas nauphoetae TaxID=2049346 RepID=A0ABQ9XBU3_9EUKA|nr:hypothetical protein BLNAU_15023 [Blattamonas nauphoetae]